MKKIVSIILVTLLFVTCKKSGEQSQISDLSDQEIINRSKDWVDVSTNLTTSNNLRTQSIGNFNTAQINAGKPGKAIWAQAKVEHYPHNISLTYLPYDSTGTPLHFSKFGFKRMLIFTYEGGEKQGFWVEVNSDNPLSISKFSIANFTGRVLVFDLNNTFLTGTRYLNGQKMATIYLGSDKDVKNQLNALALQNSKGLKTSSVNSNDSSKKVMGGGLICYDYYQRVCMPAINYCSEWVFTDTQCTYVEFPYSGGSTGDGSGGSGSGGSGSGGGGSGGSTGTGDHDPGNGGTVGVNTIGYHFPDGLYNGKDGVKPLEEYTTVCGGVQGIWNSSLAVKKETVGVITADNKFIYIAQVGYAGGSWGGLYTYQGQAYYTYPDSQGYPNQSYAGIIHSAGQYFIPIKGTVHTHSPCVDDGTDGVTSVNLSDGDQQLAARYPNLKHYIIGCDAVGQFSTSNGNGSPTLLGTGNLSTTCSLFQ